MKVCEHRVTYDEIDGQKIVFNAHYLKWADRALYEFFRAGGYPPVLLESIGMDLVVRKAVVEYVHPAYHDEQLIFYYDVTHIGHTSLRARITIENEAEQLITVIDMTYVNVIAGQKAEIPANIRMFLQQVME